MKFKKVEISAFRIYDNPENATFDFSTKTGETANFISLYAPNGFGKTSFYDAVEWGVTKSVNRFYIRSKELEKLADYQILENKLSLIRNSKSKRNTYVKIFWDSKKNPTENKFKKHGNQTHDINFKKPIVHEFQKVILSQEWVSAFLTESDGETRYQKFMEKPELVYMNNYYNNLKHQLSVYNENRDEVLSDILRLKNIFKNIESENLLLHINSQIDFLVQKYEQSELKPLTLSTTKEDIVNFKTLISSNLIQVNRTGVFGELLNNCLIAKIGDDKIIGINLFFDISKILIDTLSRLKNIQINIHKFEYLEKTTIEVSNYKQSVLRFAELKDKTDKIILLFEEYQNIQNEIDQKTVLKKKIEDSVPSLIKQLEEESRKAVNFESQNDTIIREINSIDERLIRLPILKENIANTNKNVSETEKNLEEEKPKNETGLKAIKTLDFKIAEFRKIIEKVGFGQYSSSLIHDDVLQDQIIDLEEKHRKILHEKEILIELNSKIEQQQTLNSTIQKFIQSGLAIVNERQTSICPLCEQTYETYNQLAERISNNKALSLILQELLSKRTAIINEIAILEVEVKKVNETLVEFYNMQISNLNLKRITLLDELAAIKKKTLEKEDELKILKLRQTEYSIQLNGLTADEYENNLNKSLIRVCL